MLFFFSSRGRHTRSLCDWSSDVCSSDLGFVLVAQGSGELMVEHGVHAWDVAALKPIVEEAGGRFTDWDDTPTIHRTEPRSEERRVGKECRSRWAEFQ